MSMKRGRSALSVTDSSEEIHFNDWIIKSLWSYATDIKHGRNFKQCKTFVFSPLAASYQDTTLFQVSSKLWQLISIFQYCLPVFGSFSYYLIYSTRMILSISMISPGTNMQIVNIQNFTQNLILSPQSIFFNNFYFYHRDPKINMFQTYSWLPIPHPNNGSPPACPLSMNGFSVLIQCFAKVLLGISMSTYGLQNTKTMPCFIRKNTEHQNPPPQLTLAPGDTCSPVYVYVSQIFLESNHLSSEDGLPLCRVILRPSSQTAFPMPSYHLQCLSFQPQLCRNHTWKSP